MGNNTFVPLHFTIPVAFFTVMPAVIQGTGIAPAQQAIDDPFSIGMTMLSHAGCPIFVGSVEVDSPADHAGIKGGDHLLAVEETPVTDLRTASHLLQSSRPGPISLKLSRRDKEFAVLVLRERRSAIYQRAGKHIISGLIVPPDTSQAEVDRMVSFDGRRIVGRVFPTGHYPQNPELFYCGFEMFILRDPLQVAVGGIEDGPAAKAGVHWGDVVISVNGTPVVGRPASELEKMFSTIRPAILFLKVERLGIAKSFNFNLEKAEEIAYRNGKRYLEGQIAPLWANRSDLRCFQ